MVAERSFVRGDVRVVLDLAQQVLSLDAPDIPAGGDYAEDDSPVPWPSPRPGGVTSAALLAHKCKQVDDGVRAAVELLIQRGAGRVPSRRLLVGMLAARLASARPLARGDAAEVVYAACWLGGVEANVPASLRRAVERRVAEHLADPVRSKPLGVYTWSPELARVFRQDRMLQTRLEDPDAIEAVARAIQGDPRLRAMYDVHRRLDRRLAGKARRKSLRDALAALDGRAGRRFPKRPSILPPSDSHEARLARQPFPPADVLAEIVELVKAGVIDLTPPRHPSWRDVQQWALEPLLRPERSPETSRLRVTHGYQARLDELFKAALALVRETHIKEQEAEEEEEEEEGDDEGDRDAPPELIVLVDPGLTVEPLATHYARRAESYRFLRELLDEHFGRALDETARERPWAKPTRSLREELVAVESLLLGASETARRELGFVPDRKAAPHVAAFGAWRKDVARDPDVGADSRMMVPVSHDPETGLTRVWAFLGWTALDLRVRYVEVPSARSERVFLGIRRPAAARLVFEPQECTVDAPVVVETTVRRVLDRDEFRRHCDRHRSRDAIVGGLG